MTGTTDTVVLRRLINAQGKAFEELEYGVKKYAAQRDGDTDSRITDTTLILAMEELHALRVETEKLSQALTKEAYARNISMRKISRALGHSLTKTRDVLREQRTAPRRSEQTG